MRSPVLKITLLFFLVTLFSYAWGKEITRKVCLREVCVQAEVADSPIKRQRGLMFHRPLGDNEGMLFVFEREDLHAFWMKNMHFPLDIIWINSNKRVVDIKTNLAPCRLGPCPNIIPRATAKYVLEVRSGFVIRNNIKVGDQVSF